MKTRQSTNFRLLTRLITPLLLGVCLLLPSVASIAVAGKRVALVVGANDYVHAQALGNAVSDSRLVAKTLSEIGFEVITIENPGVDAFYEGLEQFKRISAYCEVGVVYFAGHGIEVDGKNYLLPVDAELTSPGQLRSQTIALETVLNDMAEARIDAKIAILDCCRDNPLGSRSWMKTRSIGRGAGLTAVADTSLPKATLLLYSAGPGQVALDGSNGNSPFTEALSRRLKEPGQHLMEAFGKVSDDVAAATGDQQEPWVKSDGAGRTFRTLVLIPAGSNSPTTTPTPAISPEAVVAASASSAVPVPAPIAAAPLPSAAAAAPVQTPFATAPLPSPAAAAPVPAPVALVPTPPVGTVPVLPPVVATTTPAMSPATPPAVTTTAAITADLPPAPNTPSLPAAMPQIGNSAPASLPPALPQIGNTTPPPAPGIMISLPGRGYFNNEEIFQYSPYAAYNSYTKTEIVREAQRKLTSSGTPDGQMGGNTQTAIQEYQRSKALTVTGLLDAPTLQSLGLSGRVEQYPPAAPKPTYTPAPSRTYADTPPTRTYRPENDDDDDDDKKYKSDDDDDDKPKKSKASTATDQQIKDVMRSKAIQRVTRGGH